MFIQSLTQGALECYSKPHCQSDLIFWTILLGFLKNTVSKYQGHMSTTEDNYISGKQDNRHNTDTNSTLEIILL